MATPYTTTDKSAMSTPINHNAPPATSAYVDALTNVFRPVTAPIANTYQRFHNYKESWGLTQPGTAENLTKEIKQTHLTNYLFDGARADLSKSVSMNPAFQVSHSFALASATQPASYNFGAVFANASTLLQGGVDGTGAVTMRANQTWNPANITKMQGQLSSGAGQSMVQLEHDLIAPHFSLNLRSINPSPTDLTGIHMVSLLHSVSPRLSVGFESIIQRPDVNTLATSTSYLAKLTSLSNPADALVPSTMGQAPFSPSWIATAQLQPAGIVQATYYQRLSEKVDVALNLEAANTPASAMGPGKRDATATLGAKYEFRMATFRGQVDTKGKVGMLLEQRFTPAFAFLVGGEIDHMKNSSRIGVGVMIDSSTMTQEDMIAAGMIPPA